jgi:chromosome partitioning protein
MCHQIDVTYISKEVSMIVTVGGIKGGCGKSLLATNLTVLRCKGARKVLLVDGDEQGTVGDWADHRTSLGIATPWTTIRLKAQAVRTEILKLSRHYDDIIIDCGGRDTSSLRAALTVSDVFLVPFQPKSFDIWTAQKVADLIAEARCINEKLIAYALINCAGARGKDNEQAQDILMHIEGLELLPMTIGLRKAFSNATAEGLGVTELSTDQKAQDEIKALHKAVFDVKKTYQKHI